MNSELLGRLRALRELTEKQLASARRLDAVGLAELNARREELLFDIQLLVDENLPLPGDQLKDIQLVCQDVIGLEERLVRVSRTVLSAIGVTDTTDTYDRQGRVGIAG